MCLLCYSFSLIIRFILLVFCFHMSVFFFFSSRRRHTRFKCDWSSDVCSSDLSPFHQKNPPSLRNRLPLPVEISHPPETTASRLKPHPFPSNLRVRRLRLWLLQIGRASCRERV